MEPWLRPDEEEVAARQADLIKGIEQALYLLEAALRDLPEEALWWEPAPTVASIGARMQHLLGASQRLETYAFGADYDPEALAQMAEREWAPSHRSKVDLLDEARTVFGEVIARIRTLDDAALDERRPVGRRRVLVRRSVILHHLVEHAAHHVGQILLLARLWSARAHPAAESA
jgi:uncharacterized damage-inducible protein DinB